MYKSATLQARIRRAKIRHELLLASQRFIEELMLTQELSQHAKQEIADVIAKHTEGL